MDRTRYYKELGLRGDAKATAKEGLDGVVDWEKLRYLLGSLECPRALRAQVYRALLLQWRHSENIEFVVAQMMQSYAAIKNATALVVVMQRDGGGGAASRTTRKALQFATTLQLHAALVGEEIVFPEDVNRVARVFGSIFGSQEEAVTYFTFRAFLRKLAITDLTALCNVTHGRLAAVDAECASAVQPKFFVPWLSSFFVDPLEEKAVFLWDRALGTDGGAEYLSWACVAGCLLLRATLLNPKMGPLVAAANAVHLGDDVQKLAALTDDVYRGKKGALASHAIDQKVL